MKDLWNYLKTADKPIVLYGMGDGADKVIKVLDKYGIKISGVFASDGFVRNKSFNGFPVTDYKTARESFKDMIVLLCFGTALPDVIDNIKRISAQAELYAPDVPVCGGGVFDYEFYEKNLEKIECVKSILADDTSKKCFDNIIRYKLSGDISLLFECESEKDEVYKSFLKLSDKERFADLGAYRGDTVTEFIERVKSYSSVTAVEPDKKTFEKLIENTKQFKNITYINAACNNICGKTGFKSDGSRGSLLGGKDIIDCVTVDGIAQNGFTFIKMDIEGAEIPAIEGAKNTISEYKPKLQIAAYHKSADIFDIPLCVLKTNPDYRVYLRHFPCLPAWDTNYYFI